MSGEQLTAVLITTIITIGICSMLKLSVTLYAEYKNTIRENERMMKLQELSNDAIKQSLSTLESVSRMMTENERIAIETLDSLSNTKGDIEIDGEAVSKLDLCRAASERRQSLREGKGRAGILLKKGTRQIQDN